MSPPRANSILTCEEAQSMLPVLTFSHMREQSISYNVMYLASLVARGAINDVIAFLEDQEEEDLDFLLNDQPDELCLGTVLHVAMYWNPTSDMVTLLSEYGAEPMTDYYGKYPWDVARHNIWVQPTWLLPTGTIGIRDVILGERPVYDLEPYIQRFQERY
jgi:hypothetical protein